MNSHSYIGIGSVIVFAVLFILYKKSTPHELILLSRLVHFKSGAAAISPEKRGFQAHSARAPASAAAGVVALFNSKPL